MIEIPPRPPWFIEAACHSSDPELFYSDAAKVVAEAKAICAGCPVRTQCLAYAMAIQEFDWGIWGGLTANERRDMVGRKGRKMRLLTDRRCRQCESLFAPTHRGQWAYCPPCRAIRSTT